MPETSETAEDYQGQQSFLKGYSEGNYKFLGSHENPPKSGLLARDYFLRQIGTKFQNISSSSTFFAEGGDWEKARGDVFGALGLVIDHYSSGDLQFGNPIGDVPDYETFKSKLESPVYRRELIIDHFRELLTKSKRSETQELPQYKKELENFLNIEFELVQLSKHAPAHTDNGTPVGNILPQHEDEEIRTKISQIVTRAYLWGRKNVDQNIIEELKEQGLKKVISMFPPEKRKFMLKAISEKKENLERFAGQMHLLEDVSDQE